MRRLHQQGRFISYYVDTAMMQRILHNYFISFAFTDVEVKMWLDSFYKNVFLPHYEK